MSDYYFAIESMAIPFYEFQDDFCEAALSNIFTYPNQPVPLVVSSAPVDYDIADMFIMPSFSIKKELFDDLCIESIYGINWVDIKLIDKGEHDYKLMQLCNTFEAIDRVNSDFNIYEKYNDGEFITGVKKLVLNEDILNGIDLDQRLIFRDIGWKNRVFFHKKIVEILNDFKLTGLSFISVDGFSEFV